MVIAIDAHKLAYLALPKAGCSSVKEALARIDSAVTLPPEGEISTATWHALYPTTRFPKGGWSRPEGWFAFCVVRDPVKRLLSAYTDLVASRDAMAHSPRVRKDPGLPNKPDPDTFFQLFRRYRKASSLVRNHVLGAHVFLGPSLTVYDRVYRTDELGQLAEDLSARTGRTVSMPHGNATTMTLTLADLAPASIDAIRPFLDEEYAYLEGIYENPLGQRGHRACAVPVARVS